MAIVATNLTTGGDADGNSTASTASITPSANKLILLTVVSKTAITTDPNQPTASGNGLTWVVINSVVYDTTSSSRRRVTCLRAMGASPSSGALAIDFGGQNQTNVDWVIDELSDTDTSGTNGSGAIVQTALASDGTNTVSTITATLAAFGSTNNATYGSIGAGGNTFTITAGSGFIIIGDSATTNQLRASTEFRNDNDTTVDFSMSGNQEMGLVAIEIKAAAGSLIKSINGLAYASIKTINGLGIASVKTKNGLA